MRIERYYEYKNMLLDEFVEQKTKELERLEKQEDASVS